MLERSGLPRLLAEARDSLARSGNQALGYMRERDEARTALEACNRARERVLNVKAERETLRTRVAALAAELDEIRSDLRTVYRGEGPMCEALRRTYLPRIDALLAEITTPTTESQK